MKVQLDKTAVLTLFCYCREAERSVHRALSDPWPDFRTYYDSEKTASLRLLIERLHDLACPNGACLCPVSRGAVVDASAWRLVLRHLWGRCTAGWRKHWNFPDQEVRFALTGLSSLLHLLTSPSKPAADVLIALRMDLNRSGWLIESRCCGIAELKRAQDIDHFNKTEWLPRVRLSDIVGDTVRVAASRRSPVGS